jgi:hypothetical protein
VESPVGDLKMYLDRVKIADLVGKTVRAIIIQKTVIQFVCEGGATYKMYHKQESDESVEVIPDSGQANLIGVPIKEAHEKIERDRKNNDTTTYYTFLTVKGEWGVKWRILFDGYGSDSVEFIRTV